MKKQTVFGALLILLGAYLFLNRGVSIDAGTIIGHMWPTMFLLPLGVFFHWMYFSVTDRKGVGLLVPGGIVFTVGVVCQIATWFDSWGYMWPGFIMAVAVGLFELYWFGGRQKGLLIPIAILSVLSAMFFAVFSIGAIFGSLFNSPVAAIILVAAGLAVLLFGNKSKGNKDFM
ncbi:hypothetical protein [Paenibacillus thermotolerans]|uniref:hypothetical protein n=1 Tax=Paenibacillus thermotolerans TaxID=3027807 RepID=UPI002368EF59|nr:MULTISPECIES: hypothetical protein [unclassified Paenibacillus]